VSDWNGDRENGNRRGDGDGHQEMPAYYDEQSPNSDYGSSPSPQQPDGYDPGQGGYQHPYQPGDGQGQGGYSQGDAQGSYQEYEYPQHGGAYEEGAWDEPTERPAPPPGPVVPTEHLNVWVENAWNMFRAGVKDLIIVQGIVLLISFATLGLASGLLMAGYYRYAIRRTHGEPGDLNDLFSGFSGSAKATFPVGVAMVLGLVGVSSIIAVIDLLLSQIPYLGLIFRACFDLVAGMALTAALGVASLMFPLLHEQEYSLESAFKQCVGMVKANWARAALLGLAIGGLAVMGGLFFGVGVLATGPLGILIGAQAYRVLFTMGDGASRPVPQS